MAQTITEHIGTHIGLQSLNHYFSYFRGVTHVGMKTLL